MLVSRVAGMQLTNVVNEAVTWRDGPITIPDATPVATPALSPLLSGTTVPMLWAGVHMNMTVGEGGTPIGPMATLG